MRLPSLCLPRDFQGNQSSIISITGCKGKGVSLYGVNVYNADSITVGDINIPKVGKLCVWVIFHRREGRICCASHRMRWPHRYLTS